MSLQSRLADLIAAIGADQKRYHGVFSTATSATITPPGDVRQYNLLAQASALTINSTLASQLVHGQSILIRIKDNGTARAITWNSIYRAIGVTLPTTTVPGKTLYIGAVWNLTDNKWDVLAVGQEA